VTLKIYDILGREIITLVNREQSSGNYKVKFNAGKRIPSGVYFYELRTNNFHQVKKMIVEK
ncbi:MAG: T9SS type A sorting domain-containing protein, partial [Melioribacteraceae bacterium]|nr:T9SS type A sorting domain-containing protein [Melioribacteraceae bacterium]